MDEGVIKFQLHWTESETPSPPGLSELMVWRDRMYTAGLIGFDETHQVGYGNVSLRNGDTLVVSGTQTGHLPTLTPDHYTTVNRWSIATNEVWCNGPVKASSETLTHAAIYEQAPSTRVVIHIHNDELWEAALGKIPTTHPDVPYGTPQMAAEIGRLFVESGLEGKRVLAMHGHRGGLIAFGKTAEAAGEILLQAAESGQFH